jgi:hypothetical protein
MREDRGKETEDRKQGLEETLPQMTRIGICGSITKCKFGGGRGVSKFVRRYTTAVAKFELTWSSSGNLSATVKPQSTSTLKSIESSAIACLVQKHFRLGQCCKVNFMALVVAAGRMTTQMFKDWSYLLQPQ